LVFFEENTALKSVNIGGFDKKLQTYDDQISEFNEENAYKILSTDCVCNM
jgi:hypothetical protein